MNDPCKEESAACDENAASMFCFSSHKGVVVAVRAPTTSSEFKGLVHVHNCT